MVMAPAVASTMPLATAAAPPMPAPPSYVDSEDSGATIGVAFPSPPPPSRAKRKVSRGTVAGLAAVLILLLVIGTVGYLGYVATHQAPTFAVSPSTVVAGDTVLVTAKHLPNNQTGEIRLHSELVRFPFRADRSGALSGEILIPFDSSGGDHLLELCWASRCHISAILHVLEPGSSPTPSPGESPSPTPGTTPGATPAPGSSPTPVAGPSPTPRASPIPAASPTPSPAPKPTPTPAPTINLVSISQTGNTQVTFHYFYAGSATITIHQGATSKSVTVPVAPGSSTTVTFKTPTGFLVTAPPLVPQAYVTVGSLTSNSVNVTV
jgi:hypothetical protein